MESGSNRPNLSLTVDADSDYDGVLDANFLVRAKLFVFEAEASVTLPLDRSLNDGKARSANRQCSDSLPTGIEDSVTNGRCQRR